MGASDLVAAQTVPLGTSSVDGLRVVVTYGNNSQKAWLATTVAANKGLYQLGWSGTESPPPVPGNIRYVDGVAYKLNADIGGSVEGDPTVDPQSQIGDVTSHWIKLTDTLIAQGTDAERQQYTGNALQFYTTDLQQWWDVIDDTWTLRVGGGAGSSGGSESSLVAIGTDAERRSYTGDAIQYYATDTQVWWDGVDDTWTKRIGGTFTGDDVQALKVNLLAALQTLNMDNLSEAKFSDADIATYQAALISALS